MDTTSTNELDHESLERVTEMIRNQQLSSLAKQYEAALEKQNADIGFNLFEMISDHYYRETFHTDIIHAFLNPDGKHKKKEKYLQLFLTFIRTQGAKIEPTDYEGAKVLKEDGGIDILILGEKFIAGRRKAIIIENKINNAINQKKQLPRYLKDITNRGYECDTIIYLRLNGYLRPDMTGWNEDKSLEDAVLKINNGDFLMVIPAYLDDESKNDLLHGWIRECQKESPPHTDAQYILGQYGDIIRKLGGNVMNKPLMDEFYMEMQQGDNLKTARHLRLMLDELVAYRIDKILNEVNSPYGLFDRLYPYSGESAIFQLTRGEHLLQMFIYVGVEDYSFVFRDNAFAFEGAEDNFAERLLETMGRLGNYTNVDKGFQLTKTFAFPSEEFLLYEHINTFIQNLSGILKAGEIAFH